MVNVAGTVTTNSAGECCINATTITSAGTGSIAPLAVSNAALGGGPVDYNALTLTGQAAVGTGVGANNIGLLVKTEGTVTWQSGSQFMISDGSGSPLLVQMVSDVTGLVNVSAYVVVIGESSCLMNTNGSLYPLLGGDLRRT